MGRILQNRVCYQAKKSGFDHFKIIQSIFSRHNRIKLGIKNKGKLEKSKYMKIQQHILKPPMVKEEITKEMRKYFETNENKNTTY